MFFIHFEQDSPKDRIWKVQPLIDGLQNNLQKIPPIQTQSVDEIMVPFKGGVSIKQYIRNKPHKWSFKLWAHAGSDGILQEFDIYQGSKANVNPYLGVAGQVVMDMNAHLEENKNYKIFLLQS